MAQSRPAGGQNGSNAKSRAGAARLGDLVGDCIAPAIAKQGFAASDIIVYWPDIVGARFAGVCEPLRLQWPARVKRDDRPPPAATLVIGVEGAFALELQHLAAVLIERMNARLGWRCVERLAFRQGPVTRRQAAARPVEPTREAIMAAELRIGDVEPGPLRDALVRLGAHVLSAKAR